MAEDKDRVQRALHDLAAACNDAAEGYAKAAKGVHDRDVSDWLARVSDRRQEFAAAIGRSIEELGGEAKNDLHEGGILHRGWVDLEQSLRPKDDHEILRECITGDRGTLKHYDHALAADLLPHIRSLIEDQRAAVQRDIDYLDGRLSRHKTHHA